MRADSIVTGEGSSGRRRTALALALLSALALALAFAPAALATTPLTEQEEREERESVPGEWALTLEVAAHVIHGVALISQPVNAKNEFSTKEVLFEEKAKGTVSGTLDGREASLEGTSESDGEEVPATEYHGSGMAVSWSTGSASMSGPVHIKIKSGSLSGLEQDGKLTAVRVRTERQMEEEAAVARKAEEEKRAHELEATEKEEQETAEAEKAARALREQQERETTERREREAREALLRVLPPTPTPIALPPPALESVTLATRTLAPSRGGALTLTLGNPDAISVHGHLRLTASAAGKQGHTRSMSTLGEVGFSIAALGKQTVHLILSQAGRSLLARHKTLRVSAIILTQDGTEQATKTYSIVLHAAKAAARRH